MLKHFCDWLADTSLSLLLSGTEWFVPAIQTIHILTLSVVVSVLAMLGFHLLRPARTSPPLNSSVTTYVPWVWVCLVILFVTGALLTITEPARELLNTAFRLKMLLVGVLIAMTAVLWSTVRRNGNYWTQNARRRLLGKAFAISLFVVCIGIVAAGRLIAYV